MPTKSGLQLNGYMPMCMGPGYQDARDQHGLRMYLRKNRCTQKRKYATSKHFRSQFCLDIGSDVSIMKSNFRH